MRHHQTAAIALSIALASSGSRSFAGSLTARQIFQRSRQAYDSIRTLDETVQSTSGGTAHILFQRPGKLRVSGITALDLEYDLVSRGGKTWVYVPISTALLPPDNATGNFKRVVQHDGGWKRAENPETGIVDITEISGWTGVIIPALLLHTKIGCPYELPQGDSVTVADDSINGRPVYRITASTPFLQVFWIDRKTFLLVKMKRVVTKNTADVFTFNPPRIDKPIPAMAFVK